MQPKIDSISLKKESQLGPLLLNTIVTLFLLSNKLIELFSLQSLALNLLEEH